jgi:hypothetical protein
MATNNLFQLTFPEGWRETTVHTFEGPYDSGVQHNLVVTIDSALPDKIPLETWAKQQFGTTKEAMPGFEMIQEHGISLPSGLPAYEIVYKYVPADGVILFQKQVFVIAKQKGFVLSSTFSKKTLKTIAHDVDAIIASLMVLESPAENA